MADQRIIVLQEGDANPNNIIVRDLPLADVVSTIICLHEGDANPNNIILRNPGQTCQEASIASAVTFDAALYFDAELEEYIPEGVQSETPEDAAATVADISGTVFVDPVWVIDEDEWTPDWAQAPPLDELCSSAVFVASNSGGSASGGTSHNINWPASVQAGDRLLFTFTALNSVNPPVETLPAGWVQVYHGASSNNVVAGYSYVCNGTESGTWTITFTFTTGIAWITNQFRNCDDIGFQVNTEVTGSSTTPDPGSISQSWGGADPTVYVAIEHNWAAVGSGSNVSSYPTGYSNGTTITGAGTTSGLAVGTATLSKVAVSEDPGSFTIAASKSWSAWTVAVHGKCVNEIVSRYDGADAPLWDEDEFYDQGVFGSPVDAQVVDDSILSESLQDPLDDEEPVTDGAYGSPPDFEEGSPLDTQLGDAPDEDEPVTDGSSSGPTSFPDDETGETTGSRYLPDGSELPLEEDDYDCQGDQASPLEDVVVTDDSIVSTSIIDPMDEEEPVTDGFTKPAQDQDDEYVRTPTCAAMLDCQPDDDEPIIYDLVGKAPDQNDEYALPQQAAEVAEDDDADAGTFSSPLEDAPAADASILDTSLVVPDDDDEYTDTGFVQAILADTGDTIVLVTGISINIALGCYHAFGFGSIPDGPGSWVAISPSSTSWSGITGGATSWSMVPDGPGSWVTMPDGSTVWVSEC